MSSFCTLVSGSSVLVRLSDVVILDDVRFVPDGSTDVGLARLLGDSLFSSSSLSSLLTSRLSPLLLEDPAFCLLGLRVSCVFILLSGLSFG